MGETEILYCTKKRLIWMGPGTCETCVGNDAFLSINVLWEHKLLYGSSICQCNIDTQQIFLKNLKCDFKIDRTTSSFNPA